MKKAKQSQIEKDIIKLLKVQKYVQNLKLMFPPLIKHVFRIAICENPKESEKIVQFVIDLLTTKDNLNELQKQVVQIYLKYYSHSEIKAMLKFYSSKEGKSITNKGTTAGIELIQSSQRWSMEIIQNSYSKVNMLIDEICKCQLRHEKTKN